MNDRNGFELPTDWALKVLGDPNFAITSTGGTPSRKQSAYFGGPVAWVKSGELNDSIVKCTEETLSLDGLNNSAAKVYQKDAVLIALYGATVGRTAILGIDAAVNQAVCAIRPVSSSFDPKFMMFALMHLRPVLLSQRHGGAQPNISQSILRALEVPTPPLNEQRKIASVLSAIKQAIEIENHLVLVARELKAAVMSQLFTRGLRGERQKETEVGPVPESWKVQQIGENNFAKVGNGSTPKKANEKYWNNGTIPWLTSGKVHEGVIEAADIFVTPLAKAECHLPLVPTNSLVVAITGQGKTLGNTALVRLDTCINQHLAYITFLDNRVDPWFMLYYFQSKYAQFREVGRAGGSTKAALTCAYIKSVKVPVPPREEQEKIGSALRIIDADIACAESKLALLNELFNVTLSKLMSAEIRVTDLDIKLDTPTIPAQGAAAA